MAKKLSDKQIEMLRDFERDGEASDLSAFDGADHLGWHNRERCITSLHKRGLLDRDGLTDAGRAALAGA